MRIAPPVILTEEQRKTLERYARGRRTEARIVLRAKIVLCAADGRRNQEIAAELHCTPRTASTWRRRFLAGGVAALEKDAPGRGRKRAMTREKEAEIVAKTIQETPPHATQWSTRTLAAATGVSQSAIVRIWKRHGLKPHRVKSFKLSRDKRFVEKTEDVLGLYLRPPPDSIIWSVDEKTQIQALDRTQPGLPLKKGRCGTMTHDYKRNGTTTLFAALNVATGYVMGDCMSRHTHRDWLRFLQRIERESPQGKEVHVIMDNYCTHTHWKVKRWLSRHPRIHVHFTPTSASWQNMVERFFRDLTTNRIRRGVFRSVDELEQAIRGYIDHHNQHPRPRLWTAQVNDILAKVERARARLYNGSLQ